MKLRSNGKSLAPVEQAISELSAKVLTDVPAGAVFTDTVYTHPSTHEINEVAGLSTELTNITNRTPRITTSEAEPTNPQEGDVWFKLPLSEVLIPVTDYFCRYDASKLALADNAKVATWADLSSNALDLTQADDAKRPTFLAEGLNSKPTVSFATSTLANAAFVLPNLNAITVFAVCKVNAAGVSQTVTAMKQAGGTSVVTIRTSSSNVFQFLTNNAGTVTSAVTTNPVVLTGRYDKVNNAIFKNNVAGTTVGYTTALAATASLYLGISGTDEPLAGLISEFIVFPRALTTQEITDVNAYLVTKWGIT